MSHGSENDDSSSVVDSTDSSVVGVLRERFEIPVLAVVVAVMLWIRLQSYDRFVRDEEVFFSGNDAWYHFREVQYTVRNWPFTMPFDAWTNYPRGTSVGQFGTLYDQIVATVALILGVGSPSERLVAQVLLVSPAVAGALTAIPTYYVAKRITGRVPALFGAIVLMLLPGTFLRRTLVGFADHNGVEPLFQTIAVGGILLAVTAAQRERPIWEFVTAGDWDATRETIAYSAVAGTAIGLYLWVWPPGVLLVGIFGVYVVLQMLTDHNDGRPADHTAFVAAVTMATTAGTSLLRLREVTFAPTKLGLLQPVLALAIALGAIGLAWLARQFEAREFDSPVLDENGFAVTVVGLVGVAFLAVATLDVQPFPVLRNNLLRFVGFSVGAASRTIGEAQPFLDSNVARSFGDTGAILFQYGFTLLTALVGAVWMMAAPLWNNDEPGDRAFLVFCATVIALVFVGNTGLPDLWAGVVGLFGLDPQITGAVVFAGLLTVAALRVRYDAERLFVFVWAAFLTMAAFTQVRFNYYLAVSVAVFNAVFVKRVLGLADVEVGDRLRTPEIETYQLLVILTVIGLVLVPVLAVPLEVGPRGAQTQTAVATGNDTAPGPVVIWDQSLSWMQDNTPAQGTLGGENETMGPYATTQRPSDGDFAYQDGAYGVQSWWDYGHWITTRGDRAPNANPFQEGATQAANFLLAENESEAQAALEERGTDGAGTRYVMVDWKMATGSPFARGDAKYTAPFAFTEKNVNSSEYFTPVFSQQSGRAAFFERGQPYYESMVVRLYWFHGSRVDSQIQSGPFSQVVVFDWEALPDGNGGTVKAIPQGENASAIRTFPNRTAAEEFVEQDGTAKIGGIGPYPEEPVEALEQYRLVHVSNTSATQSRNFRAVLQRQLRATGLPPQFLLPTDPRWVKTFEKVPGATVQGNGAAPNETITAAVRLRIPAPSPSANATTFVYEQQTTADENGEFTLRLPYSTTGYDEYGPENGYTNVSVRATGPYSITGEAQTNESAYVLRNQTTLNVSEGIVNGDRDETITVTLNETVLREPEGAQNGSSNTTNATSAPIDPSIESPSTVGSVASDPATTGTKRLERAAAVRPSARSVRPIAG